MWELKRRRIGSLPEMRTIVSLFIGICLTITVQAERPPIRIYTSADGLWSSAVNSLMRDSHGFLWICTRDGVSRFDGYGFVNYRIVDGSAAQGVSFIMESHKGTYWIALEGGGLYRYDPKIAISSERIVADDGRMLLPAELISPKTIQTMSEDRQGYLWAATPELELIEEKDGRAVLHSVDLNLPESLKPYTATSILPGRDGSLWLGTTRGLLRRLPDGRTIRVTTGRELGSELVQSLFEDKEGRIWASYGSDFYILNPEPLEAFTGNTALISRQMRIHRPDLRHNRRLLPGAKGEAVIYNNQAWEIAPQREQYKSQERFRWIGEQDGQIWIATSFRLVRFDGRRFHMHIAGRPSKQIFSGVVVGDLDGNLWITGLEGLLKLSLRGLTSYDAADGLRSTLVSSIYENRDGELRIVSGGWFINRWTGDKFVAIDPHMPENAGPLWTSNAAFLDHTGQWWLLTTKGLYRFPLAERFSSPVVYGMRNGLPHQWIYCMFEDFKGDLWFSTRGLEHSDNHLTQWQRSTETFHTFVQKDGLPPGKSASSFAADKAGNLWFGFYQGGLVRYSKGRFTDFTNADGVPRGFITTLHTDQAGRLWLGSNGDGLARVDEPTAEHPLFRRYTTAQGLSSNNARCITEDAEGNLYVGTVRGIDRLNPDTGEVRHYGTADGLASDFVNSAYRDRRGRLWFGTFNGLSRLDPQPDVRQEAPAISITSVSVGGIRQPLSELGAPAVAGLEFGAAQHNVQISFASLSIGHAALLRYQYKLEGSDNDWSTPSDQRTVNYARLAPAKYRFLVRALSLDGRTSLSPASVSFRVLAPIWQRWWFLTGSALAIMLVILWLYRYRVAQLVEIEKVRTRIATDLHDDIGASLSQIAILSEVVQQQSGETVAPNHPLAVIASTARELVDSMSDIVWSINPNRDRLSDLQQRMRSFATDVFTARNVEFSFNIHTPEPALRLGAELRRQVFLIFKEAVNNIVRHSACSRVEIEFGTLKDSITLRLSDDGKGFDKNLAADGHGLLSMRHRAGELGAVLAIQSNHGRGTVVLLQVPMTQRRSQN